MIKYTLKKSKEFKEGVKKLNKVEKVKKYIIFWLHFNFYSFCVVKKRNTRNKINHNE